MKKWYEYACFPIFSSILKMVSIWIRLNRDIKIDECNWIMIDCQSNKIFGLLLITQPWWWHLLIWVCFCFVSEPSPRHLRLHWTRRRMRRRRLRRPMTRKRNRTVTRTTTLSKTSSSSSFATTAADPAHSCATSPTNYHHRPWQNTGNQCPPGLWQTQAPFPCCPCPPYSS